MPTSPENIKWWHWLLGVGLTVLSAAFGGGMVYQKIIDGVHQRLSDTERKLSSFYDKDGDIKFLTKDDQHACQINMATLVDGIKESQKKVEAKLDKLIELMITKNNS